MNTQKKKKKVIFIRGDWNAKVGSQEVPRITSKFITGLGLQNEAGERLRVWSREHTGHSKYTFSTTQEMDLHMDITIVDAEIRFIHYIFDSQRWRSSI